MNFALFSCISNPFPRICGTIVAPLTRSQWKQSRQWSTRSFRPAWTTVILYSGRCERRSPWRLQSVQNAAARLVTGTRRCEHITPVLRQLHWLPVRQWIQYKLASLDFVHCRAWRRITMLASVSWLLFPDGDPCGPRSDASAMCQRQNVNFGDRSFAAAGPRTWNELPFSLRHTGLSLTVLSTNICYRLTYSLSLFETTAHLWHLWFLCAVYKFTYLLTYPTAIFRIGLELADLHFYSSPHRPTCTYMSY